MTGSAYRTVDQTKRVLDLITSRVPLPRARDRFATTFRSRPRPITLASPCPSKETEVASALKAIQGRLASALAALDKDGVHEIQAPSPVIGNLREGHGLPLPGLSCYCWRLLEARQESEGISERYVRPWPAAMPR